MALNAVGQFFIIPLFSFSSPYDDGRTVKVFWDDSLNKFRVYIYTNTGTLVTEATTGPSINITSGSSLLQIKNFGYKFCNGADLNKYIINNIANSNPENYAGQVILEFPYAKKIVVENHWSCVAYVCDIKFNLTATAVTPDSGANDGTITVQATSSAGVVKFSQDPNATYLTAVSGSIDNVYRFLGMSAGTYSIYAIDQYNCKTSITVNVPTIDAEYSTRWRHDWIDLKGISHRADIEEREYTGPVVNVKASGDPFNLDSGGLANVDTFDPVKASESTLNLMSETNFQFLDLFTQDERKFRIKYYRDLKNILPTFTPASMPNVSTWSGDGTGQAWIGLGITLTGDTKSEGKYTLYTFEAGRTYKFAYSLSGIVNYLFSAQFRIYITNAFGADLGVNLFVPFISGVSGTHEFIAPLGADRISLVVWQKDSDITYYNLTFTNQTVSVPASPIGLELQWQGFVLPMLYSEPYYIQNNYPVAITATDQIANLKDLDFTDDYGNVLSGQMSILDAVCMILRKTDINIPIRESVNIFETSMDSGAEDSAIQQAFIDATIYNGLKCDEALVKLLASFGARVYQADGYWNIELIEQKGYTYAYRLFNTNGQYIGNGTTNKVSNISRATANTRSVLRDRSGLITIVPSYGTINFLIKTFFSNNLLTTGTFEESDIANGQIIGWTFDISNGAGVNYGVELFEKERSETNKSGLFVNFENTATGAKIIITPETFDLAAINGPSLVFKFDILSRPYYRDIFTYIDVCIKIGDNYVQYYGLPSTSTADLLDGEYLRFFLNDPLQWKTIEKTIPTTFNQPGQPTTNIELSGPVVIKIRIDNNAVYNYASLSAFKATASSVAKPLQRVKVKDGSVLRIYELRAGIHAASEPDFVRPNDYNDPLELGYWEQTQVLKLPTTDFVLAGVLIDNVTMAIDLKYPEQFEYSVTVDQNIKQNLDLDVYHADVDISQVVPVSGLDDNSPRLTKAYLRLNDGTPTKFWKRTYIDESRPLLDVLMEMYKTQVTTPGFKLSGAFFTDVPTNIANAYYDTGLQKYFIASSHSNRPKGNTFEAELIELKTGPGGNPINPDAREFTTEFTTEFT